MFHYLIVQTNSNYQLTIYATRDNNISKKFTCTSYKQALEMVQALQLHISNKDRQRLTNLIEFKRGA